MRTLFDQESESVADEARMSDRGMGRASYPEPAAEKAAGGSHDLTLGMTALLGIFVVVALVCAVFFGFGYSAGRTLHGTKAATPASNAAVSDAEPAEGAKADAGSAAQSSVSPALIPGSPSLTAVQPEAKPLPGAPFSAGTAGKQADDSSVLSGNDAAPAHGAPLARTSPAPAETEASGPAPESGSVMVQIAAVARQADAEMLAKALRTNGYPAVVRTEPQDKFLHVQIGPFATRDAAKAMRARLQGDGYNAFLKQ